MKVLSIFGTRPEAIKMIPIIKKLSVDDNFQSFVCVTAQHREMLDHVLDLFEIKPDIDLELMTHNQSLSDLVSLMVKKISQVLDNLKPELILVHGDTATTFSASLAAFHNKIPVAHIEAGLRTGNTLSPWPEEMYRKLTSSIASYHFSPTKISKNNLLRENISENDIFVTGNTVVDALLLAKNMLDSDESIKEKIIRRLPILDGKKKMILITGHRRENFGQGFESICKAIKYLASNNQDIQFVYPVHLNPKVNKPVNDLLGNLDNVFLIEPQEYLSFIYLMDKAHIILTDSGGIQEEAPSLGKPVLVMRNNTERPEAVDAGTVELIGTDPDKIISRTESLLYSKEEYRKMCMAKNPYGDGSASEKIIKILNEKYNQ